MDEVWKTLNDYAYYRVSNLGKVKSKTKRVHYSNGRGIHKHKGRILKYNISKTGYYTIGLYKNRYQKRILVHKLVIDYFGPPKPTEKHQVNHIDGDKSNNIISNLEWVTCSENLKHAFKLGLNDQKGSLNGFSKLTEKDILKIRKLHKTGKYFNKKLGNMFNVCRQHIGLIVRKKVWTHLEKEK